MSNFMDKLYYFDFPFKMRSDNKLLFRKGKLSLPSTGPYIISTAHDKLNFEDLLVHTKFNKLAKTGLDIYLFEVLATYKLENGSKERNRLFYVETLYNEEEHNKLHSHEFDVIQNLAEKLNIKINVYTCERNVSTIFSTKYKNLNIFCFDVFVQKAIIANETIEIVSDTSLIQKKFWCGNWRYTPARHSIMCYLANKDGNYSWHFTAPNINFLDVQDKYLNTLVEGNRLLNNQKFYLDQQVKDKTSVFNDNSVYYPKNAKSITTKYNKDFYTSLTSCFLCVITETRFGQPQANFSEKALHPIRCKRPFVLVAPPYTLQYMKELGFKTFDKWWSEEYDTETDHFKRLEKIYDLIDYINALDNNKIQKIHKEMTEIFEHNLQVIDFYRKNPFPILN